MVKVQSTDKSIDGYISMDEVDVSRINDDSSTHFKEFKELSCLIDEMSLRFERLETQLKKSKKNI